MKPTGKFEPQQSRYVFELIKVPGQNLFMFLLMLKGTTALFLSVDWMVVTFKTFLIKFEMDSITIC